MSLADSDQASPGLDVEQEMAELGITRVPVDYFHYKEFRYTSLKDAIAQARRDQALQSSGCDSTLAYPSNPPRSL